MRRALLLVAFLALPLPAAADGIYSGATTERMWNFIEDRWVVGTTPFASLRWRGIDLTAATTYDRDGIFSRAVRVSYSRSVKSWTLGAGYDTYTFRGLPMRDHTWSVNAEAPIWKW